MISLQIGDVRSLPLAAGSVDLIYTDPPYLKEYLPLYGALAREAKRVLKPGGFVFAMCGGMYLNQIFRMFDDAGLDYFWEFHHFQNNDAPFIWPRRVVAKTKSVIAYSNGPGLPRVSGVQSRFDATGGAMKLYHHWGQDVGSARYYIDYFSRPGDLVVDPFVGGGSYAVACKLLGRRFIGFDVDEAALRSAAAHLEGSGALTSLPMFQNSAPEL